MSSQLRVLVVLLAAWLFGALTALLKGWGSGLRYVLGDTSVAVVHGRVPVRRQRSRFGFHGSAGRWGGLRDDRLRRARKSAIGARDPHLRRGPRLITGGCVIALTISLSGCTSGNSVSSPKPTPSRDSPSQGSSANPASSNVFEGKQPTSAADWWKRHPDNTPSWLADSQLVLNERGRGKQSFALNGMARYRSLSMVLTCAPAGKYRLELASAKNPVWTWTAGESCGGPGLGSFTTQPLDPKDLPNSVTVQVSGDTDYYVVLYGKP